MRDVGVLVLVHRCPKSVSLSPLTKEPEEEERGGEIQGRCLSEYIVSIR